MSKLLIVGLERGCKQSGLQSHGASQQLLRQSRSATEPLPDIISARDLVRALSLHQLRRMA